MLRRKVLNTSGSGGRKLKCLAANPQENYIMPLTTVLTNENAVAQAQPDDVVILGRGCTVHQLQILQQTQPDDNTTAPTEAEGKAQVGEVPTFGRFIEFTSSAQIATQFGTRNKEIAVEIKRRYLTKGSVAEFGWIAKRGAPVTIVEIVDGRQI
jgi:hypothetical protein